MRKTRTMISAVAAACAGLSGPAFADSPAVPPYGTARSPVAASGVTPPGDATKSKSPGLPTTRVSGPTHDGTTTSATYCTIPDSTGSSDVLIYDGSALRTDLATVCITFTETAVIQDNLTEYGLAWSMGVSQVFSTRKVGASGNGNGGKFYYNDVLFEQQFLRQDNGAVLIQFSLGGLQRACSRQSDSPYQYSPITGYNPPTMTSTLENAADKGFLLTTAYDEDKC